MEARSESPLLRPWQRNRALVPRPTRRHINHRNHQYLILGSAESAVGQSQHDHLGSVRRPQSRVSCIDTLRAYGQAVWVDASMWFSLAARSHHERRADCLAQEARKSISRSGDDQLMTVYRFVIALDNFLLP